MGLTDNQKRLIQAVSQNDIQSAKKCAIACVTEDTTSKNKMFCNKYRNILESSGSNMMELPYDLKNILCVEDVSNSFKEGRYYLSGREKIVFENIVRMKKVNERLMEMGISYLNSTLLYGESGTGKTTFGRYVAYKMGMPFCYLNFSSLISSRMGSTASNISKAFNYAINNPCVFMLDEVDCISIKRSDSSDGGPDGEMGRVIITLMQEFDKLTNDIIVLGATNRIDRIDKALLRRFTVKHEVNPLRGIERINMAERFLEDLKINLPHEEYCAVVEGSKNQSELINGLIELIAREIYEDLENKNE